MHPLHRPLALLTLILAFFSAAVPAPLPTQAWRRIFNTGTNNDTGGAGDVDVSGNYYMHYVSASSTQWTSHFKKIGPTSGIYFDKTVNFTSTFNSLGTVVSPLISGKQYVYVIGYSPFNLYVYKYDTSGIVQWGGAPYVYSGGYNPSVGVFADASGN